MTELYKTMKQIGCIDIFRALHQTTAEHIFCSSTHRTLIKIDYVFNHKTNLNTVKRTGFIQEIFLANKLK